MKRAQANRRAERVLQARGRSSQPRREVSFQLLYIFNANAMWLLNSHWLLGCVQYPPQKSTNRSIGRQRLGISARLGFAVSFRSSRPAITRRVPSTHAGPSKPAAGVNASHEAQHQPLGRTIGATDEDVLSSFSFLGEHYERAHRNFT